MAGFAERTRVLRTRRLAMLSIGAIALAMPGAPALAQASVATGVGTPFELAFWQSIDSSNDASLYEAYLTRFPNGTFGEIARAKIIALHGHLAPPPASAQAMAPAVSPNLTVPAAQVIPVAAAAAAAPTPAPAVAAPAVVAPAVAAAMSPSVPTPVVAAAPQAIAAAPDAVVAPTSTMGQLLAALANSQTTNSQSTSGQTSPVPANAASMPTPVAYQPPAAPRVQSPGFVIPAQPALSPVAEVALPPSFCSAEARNAFHASVYVPSVNAARQNNDAAAAYMRQLQSLYDQYQLSRDPDTMNAIVGAARAYQQVAQATFSTQGALVRQFSALMAVPVVACSQPGQPPAQTLIK